MIVEKIKSDGLAHLSYFIGNGSDAAVIDPRRDCEVYVEMARSRGMTIRHVFETHRNEDLVSGAPILAELTGAEVWHGPNADGDVRYASVVREGAEFRLGDMVVRVLETPGHTYDSVSYVISDASFGGQPVGVFTGDALFVGDVGRTDFYPDAAREVAGLLFDSLRKLEGLGGQTLVYPAHGAGSVCGGNLADREFTSLAYEAENNPMLKMRDREAFIQAKLQEHHYQPQYFRLMEHLNLVGGEAMPRLMVPRPLSVGEALKADVDVRLDVRSTTSFAGAHLPGSLGIPLAMIAAFAGYYLNSDDRILLIADDAAQAREAQCVLARIGFDGVIGFLDGVVGLAEAGEAFDSVETVAADTVASRLKAGESGWTLLDVRKIDEFEGGHIDGARHVFVGHLDEKVEELDRSNAFTVLCASGVRAMIAASVLKRRGFESVDVFLGSMGAWEASGGGSE